MLIERVGKLLSIRLSVTNGADALTLAAMLDAVEPIKRPLGQPRKRPDNWIRTKATLRCTVGTRGGHGRSLADRAAREREQGAARSVWWIAERTLAWLAHFRSLEARDERSVEIPRTFLQLGCALIPLNYRFHRF